MAKHVMPEQVGEYDIRILKVMVAKPGEAVFSEAATTVEIVDDAAGEYVKVTQAKYEKDEETHYVEISPCEWPAIRSAIEFMVSECREDKE